MCAPGPPAPHDLLGQPICLPEQLESSLLAALCFLGQYSTTGHSVVHR